jgi:hypothetical protein
MNPRYQNGPIDCPACGASRESALAIATIAEDGVGVTARCCGLVIWQGTVVARGRSITPATVIRRVLSIRPDLCSGEAYREPWERPVVLGLEPSPLDDSHDVVRRSLFSGSDATPCATCTSGRFGRQR